MELYSATCRDLVKGDYFTKEFMLYKELKNFVIKCGYSRKLMVVGFSTLENWQFNEINYFVNHRKVK